MKVKFIRPILEEKEMIIINPLVNFYSILKKIQRKIIFHQLFRKYFEIVQSTYAFPVYLPEIGVLLSLDITSEDVARRFYEEIKNFDGFVSKGKIITSFVYNFRVEENRITSRGRLKYLSLPENLFNLYLMNLLNDFFITPSIISSQHIFSPLRWFFISAEGYASFKCILNYNLVITYFTKNSVQNTKKVKIWLNGPLSLYKVKVGIIKFLPNGYVCFIPKVPIYFTQPPKDNLFLQRIGDKGDYFLSFLLSLNNYFTSYERAHIKSGDIHIVETLTGLVFSPFDLLPLLFPLFIKRKTLNSLIFRYEVPKSTVTSILKRLIKFGIEQPPDVIKAYEVFIQERNKLLQIKESKDIFTIELVNPTVIPFLLKKFVGKERKYVRSLLASDDIFLEIRKLDEKLKSRPESWELWPISGIGKNLERRKELLSQFILIFKKNLKTNMFKK